MVKVNEKLNELYLNEFLSHFKASRFIYEVNYLEFKYKDFLRDFIDFQAISEDKYEIP